MIIIDGSQGEGGGQILRSALSLSICTGQPFRIENIRANRPRPGLMRQHLTAAKAAASISRARMRGAVVGAQSLEFDPGPVVAGSYEFAIGTAGSCTLVLQTVLLPLMSASEPSSVRITGGTHNIGAPSFDFLQRAWLPLLRRMGARVGLHLERHGFFPKGGGAMQAQIMPSPRLSPLELHERGSLRKAWAEAWVAGLPTSIAERELAVIGRELDWCESQLLLHGLPEDRGPGNLLNLILDFEHVCAVISGFGERGVRAETVASRAAHEARAYLDSGLPVGTHLADQLLLPLAIAGGGGFSTVATSPHMLSNAAIIETFSGLNLHTEPLDHGYRVQLR
ncbi:MAG: RNA 3'-terminal phosphate cyclase [Gammaproteobacteria bacterium]|nr:RNA 3'-terminal phosphate cyclase [Gammaproteobacteria bacterium]